jgi:hypothetical protein
MKDIILIPTAREYDDFVLGLFHPLILETPFYRKLIRFVVQCKAPIFYRQSDPSEHANFSLYYNFILIRESYANPVLRAMYFLHEFVHSLFYYPHDMTSVARDEFDRTVIEGEYAASNETEILAHYRVSGLREQVFQDRRIFFDVLRERGTPQPHATDLLFLRKGLIETDHLDAFFFGADPRNEPVKALLKSYRGNGAWCKKRFEETLRLRNPQEYFYPFLTPANYERTILHFPDEPPDERRRQDDYERIVLMNVRLMFELHGFTDPPRTFADCKDAVRRLEGLVLFRPARECCE